MKAVIEGKQPSPHDIENPNDLINSTNPWRKYAELLSHEGPLYDPVTRTYYLARAAHINEALRHPHLIAGFPFRATRQLFGPTAIDLDGTDHRPARRLVTWFTARQMSTWMSAAIKPVVDNLLRDMVTGAPADTITTLAQPLPTRVICRILGIPEHTWPRVWQAIVPISKYIADQRSASWACVQDARNTLLELVEPALNGGATPGTVLAELSTRSSGITGAATPLRHDLAGTALLLLAAGVVTTTAAIGNLFSCLSEHPKTWKQIQSGSATVNGVVNESLRIRPPLHSTVRFADADVITDNFAIPQHSRVRLLLAAASRDPAQFEEPHVWNPNRKPKPMYTFGAGPHACVGAQLAFAELQYLLTAVAKRYDFTGISTLPDFHCAPFHQPTEMAVTLTPRHHANIGTTASPNSGNV